MRFRVGQGLRERRARVAAQAGCAAVIGLASCVAVGCVSAKPTAHTVAIRGFQYAPEVLVR